MHIIKIVKNICLTDTIIMQHVATYIGGGRAQHDLLLDLDVSSKFPTIQNLNIKLNIVLNKQYRPP